MRKAGKEQFLLKMSKLASQYVEIDISQNVKVDISKMSKLTLVKMSKLTLDKMSKLTVTNSIIAYGQQRIWFKN